MKTVIAGTDLVNKILELIGRPALPEGTERAEITIDTNGRIKLIVEGLMVEDAE